LVDDGLLAAAQTSSSVPYETRLSNQAAPKMTFERHTLQQAVRDLQDMIGSCGQKIKSES